MLQPLKQFVAINQDIKIEDNLILKHDVGIIERIHESHYSIFLIRVGKQASLTVKDFRYFNVTQTGDAYSHKVCNVCHRLLETTAFQINQTAKDNRIQRRPSCKDCRQVIDGVKLTVAERKRWQSLNPEPQSFDIFECPICLKRTIKDLTSKVVLDHNHSTGKARGWICDSCNTGIGRFRDDISILQRAIDFIKTD